MVRRVPAYISGPSRLTRTKRQGWALDWGLVVAIGFNSRRDAPAEWTETTTGCPSRSVCRESASRPPFDSREDERQCDDRRRREREKDQHLHILQLGTDMAGAEVIGILRSEQLATL
jgi:hypothetical protein